MATEAYLPSEITFAGRPVAEPIVLTLYNPDSDSPHGSLTTPKPLDEGTRGGPLILDGTRDGRRWRITLPEIEVCNQTAVGFEYTIFGRVQREDLGEIGDASQAKAGPRLENLGATF